MYKISNNLIKKFGRCAILVVDNYENTKFLFCRKSFRLKEMRCNQSYLRLLFLQKTNHRTLKFRNAEYVKSN